MPLVRLCTVVVTPSHACLTLHSNPKPGLRSKAKPTKQKLQTNRQCSRNILACICKGSSAGSLIAAAAAATWLLLITADCFQWI